MEKRIIELECEIKRLKQYASHKPSCRTIINDKAMCDCGLESETPFGLKFVDAPSWLPKDTGMIIQPDAKIVLDADGLIVDIQPRPIFLKFLKDEQMPTP